MRLLLVLAMLVLPGPAFGDPAAVKGWLCRNAPELERCRPGVVEPPAPPMMEEDEPIEFVPVPVPAAPVPPPLVSVPNKSMPEPAPITKSAPRAAPQAKPRQRREEQERVRPAPRMESCVFPISCSTVCSYARAGSNQRGTPCQNRLGLACIQSTCPEVLRGRKR